MKKLFSIEYFDTDIMVDKDMLESCLFSDIHYISSKSFIVTDITEKRQEDINKKLWKILMGLLQSDANQPVVSELNKEGLKLTNGYGFRIDE